MKRPDSMRLLTEAELLALSEAQRLAERRVSIDRARMKALVAEGSLYEQQEEEQGPIPWLNGEPEMTQEDMVRVIREERASEEQRQREQHVSWHKRVEAQGHAPGVYADDRVTLHVVCHLHSLHGPVYDSTNVHGVPLIVTAGNSSLVPGLDKGLLTCNEGEKCVFTILPSGAYGKGGLVDAKGVRRVPGNCTLVFEVHVLKVEQISDIRQMLPDSKLQ